MPAAARTEQPATPETERRSVAGFASVAAFVAFVAAAGAGVALSATVAARGLVGGQRPATARLLAGWAGAWGVGCVAAWRLPRRRALVAILGAGMAIRLAALAGPPATSDDLYRYSWDGRVQSAGIDPYDYTPDSPHLVRLREPWLWPDDARCAALLRPHGCTRINRAFVHTIYPPLGEAWFTAVYQVAGIGARYKAWQVAGLLTEAATLALLVAALARWGQDRRWVALYALSPAPALEIVNNGHVDGLAVALVAAALVLVAPASSRAVRGEGPRSGSVGREVAAAALIAAAGLVKIYPALLLVPLVACRPGKRLLALARTAAAAGGLGLLAYAPHVATVGSKVLGYLPGYLREESYTTGARFLLARLLHVPAHEAGAVSALAVAAMASWIVSRRPALPVAGAALLGAALIAVSPGQPWYAVLLLAVATVAARPAWAVVVAAGYSAALAALFHVRRTDVVGALASAGAALVIIAAALCRERDRLLPERLRRRRRRRRAPASR